VPSTRAVSRQVFYFLHGFGGTALLFYEFVARIREHGDVLLMDLRGMGFSSKFCLPLKTSPEIIHYFVEAIEVVRQHFRHDCFTWVAHSFGSYIAQLYTSYYEERVTLQVLFSPIGK